VNRVVITGLGVLAPNGQTVDAYWKALVAGESGFATPTLADPARVNVKIIGEIKNFDPAAHLTASQVAMMDRVSQIMVVAAKQAIADSGLSMEDGTAERTAAIIGTGAGGLTTIDESLRKLYAENASRLHPLTIPKVMVNAPASQVSMACGIKGPAFVVASACASSTHAMGTAFNMVRSGVVPCALTGGTESCLSTGTVKSWEAMRILAPDTCRPFSKDRKGLVLGEGAGALIFETLDHARARGATIYAEVLGFGMSADAHDLTSPDIGGMARAIATALADAKIARDDVGYVNAHGTGTAANDASETAALHRVFGDHARKLAVSSTKSMVGHALGAAGALEQVAAVMALRDGIVPPTMNYLEPDPACDLDYVPNEARRQPITVALNNSFAFGGLNAALVTRRFS
jgi:nodulation protein E